MDPQEALKRLDVSDLGAVFRFRSIGWWIENQKP